MTNNIISGGLALAAASSILGVAAGGSGEFGIFEFLEYIQSGASVAAVMGIFLWREVRKNEKLESRCDQRDQKIADLQSLLEARCAQCPYAAAARDAALEKINSDD